MTDVITRKAGIAYFAAWIPLFGLLCLLLVNSGMTVLRSLLVAFVYCVPSAIIGHALKHMCRALPIRPSRLMSSIAASAIAIVGAASASGAFFYLFNGYAGWIETNRIPATTLMFIAVGGLYCGLSISWHYLLIQQSHIEKQRTDIAQAHALFREAELRQLRARLNPHFLFNSLNSIAALIRLDADKARAMIITLSDFLRTTLNLGHKNSITLREELTLIQNYLAIEQIRFSDRMKTIVRTDNDVLDVPVPPLILQPLVENAIKHGIATLIHPGTIEIDIEKIDAHVRVVIANDFEQEAQTGGTRTGLSCTRERINLFFGESGRLDIHQQDNRYIVKLQFPLPESFH